MDPIEMRSKDDGIHHVSQERPNKKKHTKLGYNYD